jgi:hypothetical protein
MAGVRDVIEEPLKLGFANDLCLFALADDIPPVSFIKECNKSIIL